MRSLIRFYRHLNLTRRSAMCGVLLGAILLATTGLPILVPVEKDLSTPFPCQHHRCGCRSAKACWQSCCCMTHSQKLAWAAKNKVAVPKHVVDKPVLASSSKNCCSNSSHCSTKQVEKPSNSVAWLSLRDANECRTGEALWMMLAHALLPDDAEQMPEPTLLAHDFPTSSEQSESLGYEPPSPPPRAI